MKSSSTSRVNPYSYPGACDQEGRCLTCGKMSEDTGGCLECRSSYYLVPTSVVTVTTTTGLLPYTVTVATREAPIELGCVHGRAVGQPCPHCMGLGSFG